MHASAFVTSLQEEKGISGQWKFTCQHGEQECVGNLIEVREPKLMCSKFYKH
jgi:hypothetical protein